MWVQKFDQYSCCCSDTENGDTLEQFIPFQFWTTTEQPLQIEKQQAGAWEVTTTRVASSPR